MKSIKTLSSFAKAVQLDIVNAIELSELKTIVFPYKGQPETGVVFQNTDGHYLVVLDNLEKFSIKNTKFLNEINGDDDEDDDDERDIVFNDDDSSDDLDD